jgi:hypothetical protein
MNANSRRKADIPGTAERYGETSYKQTPEEHQALLNKYMGVKGLPREVALQLGAEEERRSPRYWIGDATPRYGGSTPSSSFIQAINVSPGLNLATITMKNGRSYSYAITPDQAGDLVNSNSLGAWYNKNIKLGRSNIPVQVDPRTGNRKGPPPMTGGVEVGGKTPSGGYGVMRPLDTGNLMAMAALPTGMRALGMILKTAKEALK